MPTGEIQRKVGISREGERKICRVVEEFWLCVIPAEPEEPGAALRGPIYGHSIGLKDKKKMLSGTFELIPRREPSGNGAE